MLKIGDGSNALSDIAYVEAPQDAVPALSSAIDNKIYIDDRIDQTISGNSDLSIVKLPKEEYEMLAIGPTQLSANVLYIVESDYIDAYSQQIKNLSAGTEPFDAVNMEQLNSLSSKLYQLPANGIPGSDMQLSVQNALEKAIASISSVPSPIDPLAAEASGNYADALATKNALSSKADIVDLSSKADLSILEDISSSIKQPDWNQSLSSDPSYINNKPTALPNPNALSIGIGLSAVAYDGSAPMSLVAGENITFSKNGNEISVNAQPFPSPINPLSASMSGDYADALATKNAISSTLLSIDVVSAWADQAKSSVSVDGTKTDINIQHISQDDYAALVVTNCALSNTVYIVSGEFNEAYGQKIRNLAPGTDLSDAVNLEQVSSMIASSASETLSSIEQSDWSQSLSTEQSYIKNKPTSLPSPNALSIGNGLSAVAYDGSAPMSLVAGENIVFAKSGNEISVTGISVPFPIPIDPSFAVSSGDYADALAIKNAISSTALSICMLSSWVDQTKSTVSANGVKSDINIQHISQEDYESLVDDGHVLSNTLYIISGDYVEAYGQQMKNLAPGTELSDAVNLEQLNRLSSKFYQLPANGIPGSDMALSVQTAIEKAEASISSIPDPIDPLSATVSGQYADALATKGRISAEIDHQLDARIPYSIVEPETSGTASLSVQVQDHAINALSADSTITNILFIFPQKMTGKARDFFVRLIITSITDVPTIEFQEQDGSAVSFDIDDMSWAEIESGVNLILFTETAQ